MKTPMIRVETRVGEAIEASGWKIIPLSKALIIQLPINHAGLIWNRPVSLAITGPDGQERVVPVEDVTRRVIWAMTGGLMAWAIVFQVLRRRSRKPQTIKDE